MRRIAALLFLIAPSCLGYAQFSGWCQQGGQTVTVQGIPSSIRVQQSYPNFSQSGSGPSLTVYLTGTTNKATIYSDNAGTALANPFPCTATGQYQFFAAESVYDLTFAGTGITAFTLSKQPGGEPLGVVSDAAGAPNSLSTLCDRAVTLGQTLTLSLAWNSQSTQTLACKILFLTGGEIQTASGQTVTIGVFSCPPTQQCFDTQTLGGAIAFSQPPQPAYPDWFGAAANGSSGSASRNDAAFTALLTALGTGKAVSLNVGTGCYYKTTSITLGATQGIIGPSPFSAACIEYTGSGDVVTNASSSSNFTVKNFSIVTSSAANGVHLNGAVGLNAINSEISGIEFNGGGSSSYSNAEIKLESSFLVHVINNDMDATSVYGVQMAGSFNDTETIEINNISATTAAAVYCTNSCSSLTIRGNVMESNGRKGVWLDTGNPTINIVIKENHYENNSLGTSDYDVYYGPGSTTGPFNQNSGPVLIEEENSNNPNGSGFLYIQNARQARIVDNYCTNGGPSLINLGPAVIDAVIQNNKACSVQGSTGIRLNDSLSAAPFENLLTYSDTLSNVAWSLSGSGVTVDNSGSPTINGDPAWNLHIGSTSSGSPATIGQSYSISPAGNLFKGGIYAKTASGAAWAYVTIFDTYGVYTSTVPIPIPIGTAPVWIPISASTSASDNATAISVNFTFYPASASGASVVIIADPMLCINTLSCSYALTSSNVNLGMLNPWPSATLPTAFTPTLTINGSSTGITYTTQTGEYTKIGPFQTPSGTVSLVNVKLGIHLSSNGSLSGSPVCINGLPVTSWNSDSGTAWWGADISYAFEWTPSATPAQLLGYLNGNDTKICLQYYDENGGINAVTGSNVSSNAAISMSISYYSN